MPTQLDRTLQSKNLFFGFAGLVTAVSAWMIWGPSDLFPKPEPAGEPEQWSEADLKQFLIKRGHVVKGAETKAELVAMVRAEKNKPA